jgi:UDP-N-acetylmuramate--alanine ligase
MKIKVGIFFGGPSREREISFAGGRTVYDNLNQSLFEAIPIFVDSRKNFILLDWQYIYKGSIRDFYPPVDHLPPSPNRFQIYLESLGRLAEEEQDRIIQKVGRKIKPEELPKLISLAFLALHGEFGEDGQIQRELEKLRIPYTGSGVAASEIGMDKAIQKELMLEEGFACPRVLVFQREEWLERDMRGAYEEAMEKVGFPMVIRPANQGSSIGVSIIEHDDYDAFKESVNGAFFREFIPISRWRSVSQYDKLEHIRLLTDIRDGVGFPMDVTFAGDTLTIFHPEKLLSFLDEQTESWEGSEKEAFLLEGHQNESKVIVEEFIHGKEFSCIVVRNEAGKAIALPPTEIVKGKEVFDYRSKYMPGLSRKETPIGLPAEDIEGIRKECERLFLELGFQTYARIDGFFTAKKEIYLNDPNTTSGMLPSSFFFHQAAEIGLNPSQFLTFIIRTSLQERVAELPNEASYKVLLEYLDEKILSLKDEAIKKEKVGVFLGGYSFERHISVESGRNIFEKLSSSDKYEPIPLFLTGSPGEIELYQLPINLLLKDNADDIRDKIYHWAPNALLEQIKAECIEITLKYASAEMVFKPVRVALEGLSDRIDFGFIALHGRPGEDGHLQSLFEKIELPYNGSGVQSSMVTIDKHQTLQTLKKNGFTVTDQLIMEKADYTSDEAAFFKKIEQFFSFPLVAKPIDDGCSSAVKVIRNHRELEAYVRLIFDAANGREDELRKTLKLRPKEEFPSKESILFEALINSGGAKHFLEITGGLLTHLKPDGTVVYEIFEPSETLASGDVLSLEEKFLAGEGQNITPARFSSDNVNHRYISDQVKEDLEKVARILNVQGYARIDAFVRIFEDNSIDTIVVEVNSLPGMTPATCIFHQAALSDYKPYDFIDKIIEYGKRSFVQRLSMTPEASWAAQKIEPTEESKPLSEPSNVNTTTMNTGEEVDPLSTEDKHREEKQLSPFIRRLKNVLAFIRSGYFLRNLGAMILGVVLFYVLINVGLRWYTNHGEYMAVEDFVGMDMQTAKRTARDRKLRLEIMDSTFVMGRQPNIVIEQTPKSGSSVKERRTIYLVVTRSTPPKVTLPDLVGNYDYFQYTRKLELLEVNYKIREKVFDRKQEENTILYCYYNNQKITEQDIQRGVKVPKGGTLEFVITQRNTGRVNIPNLVCKRYDEARFQIDGNNLAVGQVITNNLPRSEWSRAFVYRQEPAYAPNREISMGTQITVYLSMNRPANCPEDVLDEANDLEEEQF